MNNGHYSPSRAKRKDFDDNNGDFLLSSPARKTRRLVTEVLPIVEEPDDECVIAPLDEFHNLSSISNFYGDGLRIEELPSDYVDGAIVPFETVNDAHPLQSASGFSVSVDPHLFSGFRNNEFWSSQLSSWRPFTDEAVRKDDSNSAASNGCLAMVPWVPLKIPSVASGDDNVSPESGEDGMMDDDEEMGEVAMDVEENMSVNERSDSGLGVASLTEGLHQWHQQLCMLPQPPYGTNTPVFWYQ